MMTFAELGLEAERAEALHRNRLEAEKRYLRERTSEQAKLVPLTRPQQFLLGFLLMAGLSVIAAISAMFIFLGVALGSI